MILQPVPDEFGTFEPEFLLVKFLGHMALVYLYCIVKGIRHIYTKTCGTVHYI